MLFSLRAINWWDRVIIRISCNRSERKRDERAETSVRTQVGASDRCETRANKGRENEKREKRGREKENQWSRRERAWKQNERRREGKSRAVRYVSVLCNARVIITGVRDGRLIMTFWMQVSDDEIRVICLSSSLRVSSWAPTAFSSSSSSSSASCVVSPFVNNRSMICTYVRVVRIRVHEIRATFVLVIK